MQCFVKYMLTSIAEVLPKAETSSCVGNVRFGDKAVTSLTQENLVDLGDSRFGSA